MMLAGYFPIFAMLVLVAGFAALNLLVSSLLGRRRRSVVKDSPYECGVEAVGDARVRFSVKFYMVAISFIIFDLEVAFLFPWAIALREIGLFGFWSMVLFLFILTVGFVYEWKKGALEWE